MKALTVRQQEIFDLIRECITHTGMSPTRTGIVSRLSVLNTVKEHLKALARKGAIRDCLWRVRAAFA
ncbi:MAG: DNA-binding transcriptional repressor LexA [Sodalis sp. Psp]|nr:DNA-binding transcriptional repressor LexA [Sodalis sp. Psp]MCR3757184.1 DNA-binding transcriptional repressor LexA [Sodalis sp. Ppy]